MNKSTRCCSNPLQIPTSKSLRPIPYRGGPRRPPSRAQRGEAQRAKCSEARCADSCAVSGPGGPLHVCARFPRVSIKLPARPIRSCMERIVAPKGLGAFIRHLFQRPNHGLETPPHHRHAWTRSLLCSSSKLPARTRSVRWTGPRPCRVSTQTPRGTGYEPFGLPPILRLELRTPQPNDEFLADRTPLGTSNSRLVFLSSQHLRPRRSSSKHVRRYPHPRRHPNTVQRTRK